MYSVAGIVRSSAPNTVRGATGAKSNRSVSMAAMAFFMFFVPFFVTVSVTYDSFFPDLMNVPEIVLISVSELGFQHRKKASS